MPDTFALVLVVTISFAGGLLLGFDLGRSERKRTKNFEPVEHGDFDEEKWVKHPPPWPLGSVGERPWWTVAGGKPPVKIVRIYQRNSK